MTKTKTIYFKTGKYFQKVQIPSLKYISRLKGTDKEKVEIAMDDDVKVFCSCPDFLYSGQKYIAWQTDYGTDKENRPPKIRNPKLDGSVCKHLKYLLSSLDNYSTNVTEDMAEARKNNRKMIVRDKGLVKQIKQMGLKKGKTNLQ